MELRAKLTRPAGKPLTCADGFTHLTADVSFGAPTSVRASAQTGTNIRVKARNLIWPHMAGTLEPAGSSGPEGLACQFRHDHQAVANRIGVDEKSASGRVPCGSSE